MVHARRNPPPIIDEEIDEDAPPLSDEEVEGMPAPGTVRFLATVAQAWDDKAGALTTIGGNIFIHLHDVGSWTLVTSGRNAGFHEGATEDTVDFALICEEYVLDTMLYCDAGEKRVLEMLREDMEVGNLEVQGDPKLLKKLVALLKPQHAGLVSLLAAR